MAKQELGQSPILDPSLPLPPAPSAATYGPDGRLTYESMTAAVRNGGAVQYKGRILSSAASLPSELEYAAAGGDQSQVKQATVAVEQRIAELQAELDRMKATAASGPQNAPGGPAVATLKAQPQK